jgi:hypothetical protein
LRWFVPSATTLILLFCPTFELSAWLQVLSMNMGSIRRSSLAFSAPMECEFMLAIHPCHFLFMFPPTPLSFSFLQLRHIRLLLLLTLRRSSSTRQFDAVVRLACLSSALALNHQPAAIAAAGASAQRKPDVIIFSS